MRRNILKRRLKRGETVIGTMVQEVGTPSIAQVFKQVGFDFFMVDMEHGPFSLETAAHILRVGRILDMCPLVRVAGTDYHLISQPLDHGAMGIMLPRVETRDQLETLVACVKYPPVGRRGFSSDAPHSEYSFGPAGEFLEENNLLKAPFEGMISGKYYEDGELYSGAPNTMAGKAAIVSIVQIDPLKVVVNISETYFPLINMGMDAAVTCDIYPDKSFPGKVMRIHPTIDPATRSFIIEIKIIDINF